ncbi:uncharacterized protein LOC106152829 isoform X2 [Lingula anatina]|nr:uncharacterized protein LOC106152829 isoform X2 [Lingula anatina]XP_013382022.1 uncharacterized protein LOC106152829 isoform X2 [Lingula anatina]|eukprot:XP_013382021.1 uncharacterized protein LOC106152829 isoform X2 [Lingula anatina]
MPPVTANLEETCKNANVTALSGKDFTCSFQLPVRESVFSTYVLWNSQQLFQHVQNSDEPIHRFTNFTGLKDRRYMTILAGLKDRMNVTILNNGHVSMRIKAARPEDSGTYTFQQVFSDRKPINTSLKINFVNAETNSSIPENTTIPETDSPLPPKGNWEWIAVVVVLVTVGVLVGLVLLVVFLRRKKRGSCTVLMRMASRLCKRQKLDDSATSTDTISSSDANGSPPSLGKDLNTLEMMALKTLGGKARLNDSDEDPEESVSLQQGQDSARLQQGDGTLDAVVNTEATNGRHQQE